eukprot:CAMPEP_0176132070 /NCGR_PEP_ID=MMETSP0120_2-20121206/66881_1 /TAXON_ID=160619 /ORGANISM="Kryptoperidinium foliaceum, Strain CCMP 1326" /LENGTH=224 /DNA_ID=CAMNT_0017467495 /DNA_START=150 /DNA_END=822 /DNA_ORIENTATION=-
MVPRSPLQITKPLTLKSNDEDGMGTDEEDNTKRPCGCVDVCPLDDACKDAGEARMSRSHYWLQELTTSKASVSEMVTSMGTVSPSQAPDRNQRAEALAVDILLDLWELFPETAKKQLEVFRQYGRWCQLFLLIERSSNQKASKKLCTAVYELLKEQWLHDIRAIEEKNGHASGLVISMPQEGSIRDEKLGFFIKKFLKIAYVRDSSGRLTGAHKLYTRHRNMLK